MARLAVLATVLCLLCNQALAAKKPFATGRPLVIGHRGACGFAPEHTMMSYYAAVAFGADCIECDVTVTKDLHLVCRHDLELSGTTDALEKFPEKLRTYNVDGTNITDIFVIDLTLAEIKQLRAKQAMPARDHSYDFLFEVPTFDEYVHAANDPNNDRVMCIYPETKHPQFHDNHPVLKAANTTISQMLLDKLNEYNYTGPYNSSQWLAQPAFIQSFEVKNLQYLSKKTNIPLIQLVDQVNTADTNQSAAELLSESGIKGIAQYAQGVAPWKGLIVKTDIANHIISMDMQPGSYIKQNNLLYHTWTMRNEPQYLATNFSDNPYKEYDLWINILKSDGFFTDFALTYSTYLKNESSVYKGTSYITPLFGAFDVNGSSYFEHLLAAQARAIHQGSAKKMSRKLF